MKIFLPFVLGENAQLIMRRAGYASFSDPNTGVTSFVKRLNRDYYPRFHVYVENRDGQWQVNLHLDQKKPSYQGAHAHNAEYDGELVSVEAERIKNAIAAMEHDQQQQPEIKKSFFQKLFR